MSRVVVRKPDHRHVFPAGSPSIQARTLSAVLWFLMRRKQEMVGPALVTPELLRQAARDAERQTARNRKVPSFVRVDALDVDGVPAEWVTAGHVQPGKVILYFHGGAYFMCSAATYRPITSRLARAAERRVLAIDYRMAPDHRFPAWLEDGVKSYRWLLAQGHRPGDIVIGGDSAGGNLALVTLQQIRHEGLPMPAAAFVLSPWADLSCSGTSMVSNRSRDPMFATLGVRALAAFLTEGHDPKDPLLSPLYADFRRFPPLLVHACSTELLRDDARRLVDRARVAGVQVTYKEWHRLPHVFHLFAGLIPESAIALTKIGNYVREH